MNPPTPEKLVFFGKGGSGKSTISSNLSAIYARSGLRVLHVGCDPKRDSTALLVARPEARSVLTRRGEDLGVAPASEFLMRSRLGLDCVEAGGPEPGVGCAGRGISKMIEVLERDRTLERGRYEIVIFDVLGDVVCGGFAAPLRLGFGEKVVIVVSEEAMSLYAANNIAHAVRNYSGNGVGLCGLLANLRDPAADVALIERFARGIGTSVIGVVGRDPAFREAERLERCLTELKPRPRALRNLERIAERLRTLDRGKLTVPTPMSETEFYEANRRRFLPGSKPGSALAAAPEAAEPRETAAPPPPSLPARAAPPALKALGEEGAAAGAEPPYSRWMMWTWGVEEQWRQFFADPELALNSAKPLLRHTAFVVQKELECFFVEARSDDGAANFFNHPWPAHCTNVLPLPFELRRQGSRQIVSDIKDGEIILGSARKMEAMMTGLAADPGTTELAVFLTSCPAVVIGDDNAAVIERFRRRSGIPTLFPDRDADQHTDLLGELFSLAGRTPRPARAPGRLVNLVGFPRDRALGELTVLLGELGITVNSCLLPEFDRESIARYADADLQVVTPHREYEGLHAEIMSKLAVPSLSLEAPYGMEGTRRWLRELAGFFALQSRFEEVWGERWEAARPGWETLRRRAGEHALGFVCDAQRLALLRDGRSSAGIPLPAAIREMGFGLHWLLWCGCGGATAHKVPRDAKERETIRRFHSPAELDALLRERPADAVYSDIFFDARLSRAGKSQFSLPFFEPGIEGAARTIERLLGACRMPLYKDYARYLSGKVPDA